MKRILCCLGLTAAVCSAADLPPIIVKAREYLGGDAVVSNIHSVHLTGTMTTEIVGDAGSKRVGQVDIIFQKPLQELIASVEPDLVMRRAIDDYDGWLLQQRRGPGDPGEIDPRRPQTLTIMGPEDVRSMRADTWENLYYYSNVEMVGGTVEDLGPADADGVHCERVRITHTGAASYDRYFDLATGRLVYTLSGAGAEIREFGSQIVDGVRFSQKITIDEKSGGKPQKTTIEFTKVKLNEVFPDGLFATPLVPLPVEPPVRSKAP